MKRKNHLSKTKFCCFFFVNLKFNFYRKIQDSTSTNKRSSLQKNLNLSPSQRLENLIQASTNDSVSEGMK
jgi:hypothetical protein